MLVEDALRDASDGGTAAQHQDGQAKHIPVNRFDQYRGWFQRPRIRIQPAALVYAGVVIAHDGHRAARQLAESLLHPFHDLLHHRARHRAVLPHFEEQMRNARVVAQRTSSFFGNQGVVQHLLHHPARLRVRLIGNGLAVSLLLVFPERGTRPHKAVGHFFDYISHRWILLSLQL